MADTDTSLGRPPRHGRDGKRSAVKRAVLMDEKEAQEVACSTCSKPVEVPAPASFPAVLKGLARVAAAQIAGSLPVHCEGCIEREAREEREREDEAERAAARQARHAAAGLPTKWAAQTFDGLDADPKRREARRLAEAWGAGELRGLVLYGPVGRGKTALAAAAANARLSSRSVRWLPVAELMLDMATDFNAPERKAAVKRLDATRGRAALVLDDLDKLKPTEHAVAPLYMAINAWVEAELPLLVTLNRDLDELARWLPDTFGEAVASRLAGYCEHARVGGDDRRLG